MQRLLCVGMSALLLAMLSGCGLKYDLYLPEDQGSSSAQTELTIFLTEEPAEAEKPAAGTQTAEQDQQ